MPTLFETAPSEATFPLVGGFAITPSDSTDLPQVTRTLWVGGAGNVSVQMIDGTAITLQGCAAGQEIPVRVRRVYATGTTASNIVGLY